MDALPPRGARVMFKVVALRPSDGAPVSVYDGDTPYWPGRTLYHEAREDHGGGLYCFTSLEECVLHAGPGGGAFPSRAALRHAPKMIAKVLAWWVGGRAGVDGGDWGP